MCAVFYSDMDDDTRLLSESVYDINDMISSLIWGGTSFWLMFTKGLSLRAERLDNIGYCKLV